MTIYPSKLSGVVSAPPSKSMAHRAIICAALACGKSRVLGVELSEDIMATIGAVSALGAKVEIQGEGRTKQLNMVGVTTDKPADTIPEIDCGESGSTLRFMIPVALASAGGARFSGSGRLPERPIGTYEDLFIKRSINWIQGEKSLPLEVKGKLESGIYEVPGDISSQYITGLLFALPMLDGDSEIRIKGSFESKKYVDMTVQMLELFGIEIKNDGESFCIPGGQKYKPADYIVEGDWSNAAFLLLMGVLGGGVKISGLKPQSLQGDREIVEVLKKMGADIGWQGNMLEAKGSGLKSAEADVSQCPDLAPAIAAAMSVAKGKSRITGGQRLKIKETDRISSIAENLNRLGAKVTPADDGMTIEGVNILKGGNANGTGDHRISMMAAAISPKCENAIELMGKDSVNKSYPSFWEDFVMLGGKIK